ncbi:MULTISPECIES: malto-oligosyltrehalose synthase [unclassified Arthrobacter]|uniref:malto-oligosyltrehalose synthase n=1 Tax=unclassified Arthrobacter TaxID=235627 RepID=UPI002E0AF2D5|nr:MULTISPECIES: malto-oligosyltrehalose synthase [unclassified Arthrobacter]MEC5190178.1 (1->4)-alpha-D-glucan 1-alpha-D-glucosylmutase [Arthrobacter sp. MP_M4]MEC5201646.1 (1->4)-alpha-D-glucan 1-alpha-D-glucosylmutase [Arthrobacter sp. MP_M7]
MRTPVSTYRLQIRPGFTLQDAAETVPYLKSLGVDWIYLSPILTAEKGSDHGYDVTDPSAIDPDRGGAEGLAAASKAAHDAGMGVLVDIVPNHVGVATPVQNPWWWSLLQEGKQSRYAAAFDVDWDFGAGRVRIPVLGEDSDVAALEIKDGELRYYDHRFPLAEGTYTAGDDPREVHDRQHYELVGWRRADNDLNYRRFFAVNSLAGIRVELPEVFDEAHAEIVRWFSEGLVDGLRIDHPDGLADPEGYLHRLREVTGGSYLLIEKILEPGEELPSSFDCEGTTGYDALADVDRLFVDPAGQEPLDALDTELRGGVVADYDDMIRGTKRRITDGILHSEMLRLARLVPAGTGLGAERAADALSEIIAAFPVYRSYLPEGAGVLKEACELAVRRRPELADAVGLLQPLLLDAGAELGRRFQQTSGMVMAKGVEDTAFFRYTRLGTLTEVGADPTEFSVSTEEFHRRMTRRKATIPLSMTTLSTHDTKRSEDTRARISVLAELAPEWQAALARLQELAPLPDGPLANLLWQALAGAWPADRERLQSYAQKAAREAGNSTDWLDPDAAFEEKLAAAVDAAFDNPEVRAELASLVELLSPYGAVNSLGAKLVQLTMPGVPDVYQGTEFWDRSLTDPDNRRPFDYGARRAALAALDAGERPASYLDEAAKLLVTSRALRLRRDRPELFTGYRALTATGAAAGHLVGFDRGSAAGAGAVTLATRLPRGLEQQGGWRDTAIDLADAMTDELTGATFGPGSVLLAEVLGSYPIALLVPAKR